MKGLLANLSSVLCGMLLPALLFVCGIMFFIRLGRYVFSPRFLKKGFSSNDRSTFNSLWLALGGTLGVGNICGVAFAIYIGGAGCVFWIWVSALLSAVTKYAETVLAVHYRDISNGRSRGGAPYYIQSGLGSRALAVLFCVLCIFTAFTMGNITQVKVASDFAKSALDVPMAVTASVFAASVFILALGKGKRISSFTSKTVPMLCVIYTLLCIASMIAFRENIPALTKKIFTEAFTPKAGLGGALGMLCSPALRLGITRGVMSNEAGCGTAPIAYAADINAKPVRSGLLGICEVLVDTLVLCSLTAYALLLPCSPLSENSADCIISAFTATFGTAVKPLLAVSVFLFALASVAAWAFYATESAEFLGAKKRFAVIFASAYAITAFCGCFMKENTVWALADISVSAMAVLNVFSVILLFGKVKEITKKEYVHQKNINMKH